MTELLVIGAGLSGLVAALTAAEAGHKVEIIAKGLGALHWSAGTIDTLGYYPDEARAVIRPIETAKDLVRERPDHPFALLGDRALSSSLNRFLDRTKEIGLPYSGASHEGDNIWLPSPVGAARPTFLAPAAQLAGDLSREEPMLIVGLKGMRDFFPELIAENMEKSGHPARAAFLPIDLVTARHDNNSVHLASELDRPEKQTALAKELKRLVRPGERVSFPAILGLDDHTACVNNLRTIVGVPIFEIPTLPPSVPGIRLNTALRRRLEKLRVRVQMNMDVIDAHSVNGRILWVESEASGRPLKHRADRFLVATGGILGGGISSDHKGRVWETIFDLPVFAPPVRGDWFRAAFFDPEGHPIFRGGVIVNRMFQPVDENGRCLYSNLWAAGSLLAHADALMERSLEGVAIATGTSAAQKMTA